jgi:hypothetical protein
MIAKIKNYGLEVMSTGVGLAVLYAAARYEILHLVMQR